MKPFGYVLITAGFLAASYVAVIEAEAVPVVPFLGFLGLGVLGVATVRIVLHRASRHEEVLAGNIQTIGESLTRLAEEARKLEATKDHISVYDLRHAIDEAFPAHLDRFVLARESIAHRYGLQAYADVMNPFAAAERYIYRVWSASTDGYIDEAHTYIVQAREQFEEAVKVFEGLTAPAAA